MVLFEQGMVRVSNDGIGTVLFENLWKYDEQYALGWQFDQLGFHQIIIGPIKKCLSSSKVCVISLRNFVQFFLFLNFLIHFHFMFE